MALTDFLGGLDLVGGVIVIGIAAVVVVIMWQFKIWKIILWPFQAVWWIVKAPFRFFGLGGKNIFGLEKYIGKNRLDSWLMIQKEQKRSALEGQEERQEQEQLQQEIESIEQAKQILQSSTATPQEKMQALAAVFNTVGNLVEFDQRSFKRLYDQYGQDAASAERVAKDMRQMLKAEKRLEGISLKETETIVAAGGKDPTGGQIIQIIQQKLKPLEQQVMVFETQARGKDLELRRLAKQRIAQQGKVRSAYDQARDSANAVEQRGQLLPQDIQTLLAQITALQREIQELEIMTGGAIALIAERTEIQAKLIPNEASINDSLAQLDKAIEAHRGAKAQNEAETKLTG